MFDKVAKFSKIAYRKLRPELGRLRKYAGPHAEEMLGMTPVGQMLGLGAPGGLDKVYGNPSPYHNPHVSQKNRHRQNGVMGQSGMNGAMGQHGGHHGGHGAHGVPGMGGMGMPNMPGMQMPGMNMPGMNMPGMPGMPQMPGMP